MFEPEHPTQDLDLTLLSVAIEACSSCFPPFKPESKWSRMLTGDFIAYYACYTEDPV